MTNTNTNALNETQTAWLNALGFEVVESNGENFTARAFVGGSEEWTETTHGAFARRDRVVFARDGLNFTVRGVVANTGRSYAGGYSGPDARKAARTARELLAALTRNV